MGYYNFDKLTLKPQEDGGVKKTPPQRFANLKMKLWNNQNDTFSTCSPIISRDQSMSLQGHMGCACALAGRCWCPAGLGLSTRCQ